MPSPIAVNNEAFGDFIKVASLPAKERRLLFSKQSNEQKASFIKVNLALQFIKRPNMTNEQKEFVLDAISKVSVDLFDRSPEKAVISQQIGLDVENKALGLFTLKDAGDFIEPLATGKDEEVSLLQKYEDLLKNGMIARKAIAKEMPVNDRVNIWKTQLAYHLATGKFSKIQNEFILEVLTSLSPETFASRANLTKEEEAKAIETLESTIFNVFTKEEGFAIFMALGIQKYVKDEPIDIIILRPATCDCNAYCPGQPSCSGSGCISSPDGCGPFGLWGCHSLCVG